MRTNFTDDPALTTAIMESTLISRSTAVSVLSNSVMYNAHRATETFQCTTERPSTVGRVQYVIVFQLLTIKLMTT